MPVPSQSLPVIGQANATEDPKIRSCLLELQQLLDKSQTGLVGDNVSPTLAQILGISQSGVVSRGKTIIAATETRTNVAYGLLTTPDRVSNVVLSTDGLIAIGYQATWQESVNGAAKAAIFLGANQLKLASNPSGAPSIVEATINVGASLNKDTALSTYNSGIASSRDAVGTYSGDVTTGQIIGTVDTSFTQGLGGPCYVFAAAGTYDITVQFKASSGNVVAKNRKLWVWTVGF